MFPSVRDDLLLAVAGGFVLNALHALLVWRSPSVDLVDGSHGHVAVYHYVPK